MAIMMHKHCRGAAYVLWVAVSVVGVGCSLFNREGPDVTCKDLQNGTINACAHGIIASCVSHHVTYQVCTSSDTQDPDKVCGASWQNPGAYRCRESGSGRQGGASGSGATGTGGTGAGGSGGVGGTGGTGGASNCPTNLGAPSASTGDCSVLPTVVDTDSCPIGCGLPAHSYTCDPATSGPALAGCVHVVTAVIDTGSYCCPEAACVRHPSKDTYCVQYGHPPKAYSCHPQATTPAGCVPSGYNDTVCCPN